MHQWKLGNACFIMRSKCFLNRSHGFRGTVRLWVCHFWGSQSNQQPNILSYQVPSEWSVILLTDSCLGWVWLFLLFHTLTASIQWIKASATSPKVMEIWNEDVHVSIISILMLLYCKLANVLSQWFHIVVEGLKSDQASNYTKYLDAWLQPDNNSLDSPVQEEMELP